MQTTDGYTITTIEQDGAYAGEDMGKLHILTRPGRRWYSYPSEAERTAAIALAQQLTADAFDAAFHAG